MNWENIGNNNVLKELLSDRGILITDKAGVTLVPRGAPLPEKGIVIIYDEKNPEELVNFIDSFKSITAKTDNEIIIGKRKHGYSVVPVEQILFFMAWGNYVYCHTVQERFEINQKLYEIERNFRSQYFIRINKSYVVNIRWIREIIPWFGGRLLLKLKEISEELEVSRNYVKAFKRSLSI
ncbi:MAG: LytTR family transcriptional regulator [Spirochaetales bacterium]|nr:LytTR family transcriptional regulator [Spirochaetales bacterium]